MNDKEKMLLLLLASLLTLTLTSCGLFGQSSDQVEEQLQESGINELQLDFQPD